MKLPFFGKPKEPANEYDRQVKNLVDAYRWATKGAPIGAGVGLKNLAEAKSPLYESILSSSGDERTGIVLALLKYAIDHEKPRFHSLEWFLRDDFIQLAGRLAAARGGISPARFADFVQAWIDACSYWVSYARVAGIAEYLVAEYGLTPEIETPLRKVMELQRRYLEGESRAEDRKYAQRILALLDPEQSVMTEPWQVPFKDGQWQGLVDYAATAKSVSPSDRWIKGARPLLEAAGPERFLETFGEAVDAVNRMPAGVDAVHCDMLRGLAWFASLAGTQRAAALLGRLVLGGAFKISGHGPRSQKAFSGAVSALERMGTFESLAALSNARNRIKAASLSATLTAALTRAAEAQNLPLADLEELVVPTYALESPGVRVEELGTVQARLEITGEADVELRWFRDGKELKSPPAEVKNDYPEELKELKASAKDMAAMLAGQRARIEGLMLSGRTLSLSLWRERYLEHPLLAQMTRRLVWEFTEGDNFQLGMAPEGEILDVHGDLLSGLTDDTSVRLWHPIRAGASAIEAWRDFILAREIRQPFKQAFREIYILTAAEERTAMYSNRFAAHVLKQHQMNALARARGWRYALQGAYDGMEGNPTLDLPQWGLQVEYFAEVADMGAMPHEEAFTDVGVAFYVVTDQVRYLDLQSGYPVPLAEIPPIVLSETMRDVDLFVGVASVGNDPNWQDQGQRTGFGAYWRTVSFGDLSASAQTRKEVLERLLPRLAIGKVSRIEGKFLVVQGKRHAYKIHLGSGNILMSPNDRYLCIVPGAPKANAGGGRVYLPFEGDGVLAIILSKAMMLMNDDKITDKTITRQL